ncbi:hypothetical protein [Streptomyces sp. NBC_00859]|nr:hypothetical protein OG584_10935 [Streptomyces sp. NBC_00859]
MVTTDYDLLSTCVGCSGETAERIPRDDAIEALPVTAQTRGDWYAERPR